MDGIDVDLDYDEDGTHQENGSSSQDHHQSSNRINYTERAPEDDQDAGNDNDEDSKRVDAERRAKRFGIEPISKIEISKEDLSALCADLRIVSGLHTARTVLVKGIDGMTKYTVEKIFAAFHPYRVEVVDDSTAFVLFTSKIEAAAMFIDMSKSLRRIKKHRPADEEGEVLSDDEDGQLKDEAGDDVAVVMSQDGKQVERTDVVEVDIREVNIPDGRWRVITKHVPEHRLLLARYAAISEVNEFRKTRSTVLVDETRKRRADGTFEDTAGYTYNWNTDDKVRPGLNIFDHDGNELEWDYEHDTRFYVEEESEKDEKTKIEEQKGAPTAIKIKGRGAKKGRFLYEGGGSTLASDNIEESKNVSESLATDRDSDVDSEPDLDPTPTLQPWDRPSRLGNRLRKKAEW